MDTKRLILFVIFSFSLMLLWDSFQKQNIQDIQDVDIEQPINVDQDVPEPISDSYNDNDLVALPKTKINSVMDPKTKRT